MLTTARPWPPLFTEIAPSWWGSYKFLYSTLEIPEVVFSWMETKSSLWSHLESILFLEDMVMIYVLWSQRAGLTICTDIWFTFYLSPIASPLLWQLQDGHIFTNTNRYLSFDSHCSLVLRQGSCCLDSVWQDIDPLLYCSWVDKKSDFHALVDCMPDMLHHPLDLPYQNISWMTVHDSGSVLYTKFQTFNCPIS